MHKQKFYVRLAVREHGRLVTRCFEVWAGNMMEALNKLIKH